MMQMSVSQVPRIQIVDCSAWQLLRKITELKGQEEAFMVMDVDDIVNKYKNWKLKIPRVQPFYAVKCNDNQIVLRVLAALGTGFDCASKKEISDVLRLGVSPQRIIFAHTTKQNSHLHYALTSRIDLMTFDNVEELYKIKEAFPLARLLLRFRYDAAVSMCKLGLKFGTELNEVDALLDIARELGMNIVGVSFHVGSGCEDPQVFSSAITVARNIFDRAETFGFNFDLLDIGGGFPGHKGSSIDEFADIINRALSLNFPDDEKVRVIAEPGRYFVASCCTLATSIHSKRRVLQPNSNTDFMYYINDGMYGSFGVLRNSGIHVITKPVKDFDENSKQYSSTIWGPTCDSADLVIGSVNLPELHRGDWLAFENRGAYSLNCACEFNGMPSPNIIAICSETACSSSQPAFLRNEISDVLRLGVSPRRIIFAHTTKQNSHLHYALTSGIDLMTFDNADELYKIKESFPLARLILRFRHDAAKSVSKLGLKFGAELNEVDALLDIARELGMNIVGVSFHVGSGCEDPQVFSSAIAVARNIFDRAENFGFNFDLLDIGGGFPGHKGSSIDEFADIINSALALNFPGDEKVRVIAEPGRYFVASCCTLATNIHSRRRVLQPNSNTDFMYYINDGMYGSFGVLRNRDKTVITKPVKDFDETSQQYSSTVWGPTCDSADLVIGSVELPELHRGDWLAFENRGAYSLNCACDFNGMPSPNIIAMCSEIS
ncbi:hypothetical protein B566_EDAN002430 [Ephemera danica]|nr:hypothetical protein B566_EDAN002430 [Ephemera danica]